MKPYENGDILHINCLAGFLVSRVWCLKSAIFEVLPFLRALSTPELAALEVRKRNGWGCFFFFFYGENSKSFSHLWRCLAKLPSEFFCFFFVKLLSFETHFLLALHDFCTEAALVGIINTWSLLMLHTKVVFLPVAGARREGLRGVFSLCAKVYQLQLFHGRGINSSTQ